MQQLSFLKHKESALRPSKKSQALNIWKLLSVFWQEVVHVGLNLHAKNAKDVRCLHIDIHFHAV